MIYFKKGEKLVNDIDSNRIAYCYKDEVINKKWNFGYHGTF